VEQLSLFRRVGRWAQNARVGLHHQRSIYLGLRSRPLPVRVSLECCPALFPVSQAGVAEHLYEPVTSAEDFRPIANIRDPVLFKEAEGVVGEPVVEVRQFPRHRLVDAPLVCLGRKPGVGE
jgi:hypothetical protein